MLVNPALTGKSTDMSIHCLRVEPLTLLILSATLNGGVMFLYSGLLLWMNVRSLRPPLRPTAPRIAALVGSILFFGYFTVLTLLDQLGLVE